MTASWPAGTVNTASPSAVAPACARAQPRKVPRPAPPRAPKADTSTDSSRIMDRACARVCPTARSRPISLVRSWTDSDRVFAMPETAITMASASST